MPIIQDPRMNPRRESILGIAYIEDSFILEGTTYQRGHYFYKKKGKKPTNVFNIRYLPQGFPVVVKGIEEPDDEDWDDVNLDYYKTMFPNLQYDPKVVLNLEADPGYIEDNPPNLDSRKPMVAYLNRYISDQIKGTRKFNRGALYNYERAEDELRPE